MPEMSSGHTQREDTAYNDRTGVRTSRRNVLAAGTGIIEVVD